MDVETSHAIESLRGDIQQVESGLRVEIQRADANLRGEIQRVDASLRGEIQRVDVNLRGEIQRVEDSLARVETTLRAEIGNLRLEFATRRDLVEMREELKRHTDVRFESLRDDIRIVAEGFAAIRAKLDSINTKPAR